MNPKTIPWPPAPTSSRSVTMGLKIETSSPLPSCSLEATDSPPLCCWLLFLAEVEEEEEEGRRRPLEKGEKVAWRQVRYVAAAVSRWDGGGY